MGWLRLDAAAFEDRALRRHGMRGRVVFMAAVMLSKERDWTKAERRGWLPAREFDGLEVARHWDDQEPDAAALYDAMIATLAAGPHALFAADSAGDGWWIAGWEKYQPDPTALMRKRKERARRWKEANRAADVTVTDSDARTENDSSEELGKGHVSHSDKRDKPNSGFGFYEKPADDDARHRDDRDVTLRDDTTRDERRDESRATSDETSHVSSPRKKTRGAAPSPARPGAEAVAAPDGINGDGKNPTEIRVVREVLEQLALAPQTRTAAPQPPIDTVKTTTDPAKFEETRRRILDEINNAERHAKPPN